MKAHEATPSKMLERFPDLMPAIVKLHAESEDFRELCDHYAECLEVLESLQTANTTEPQRIAEYETLTTELADEIRNIVASAA